MLQNNFINEYDGLIFDMDGTVIDTMPSHAKAWEMVGQHFGYPFDGNLLYEMGGAPVKDIALEMMKRHAMPLDKLDDVIELKKRIWQTADHETRHIASCSGCCSSFL